MLSVDYSALYMYSRLPTPGLWLVVGTSSPERGPHRLDRMGDNELMVYTNSGLDATHDRPLVDDEPDDTSSARCTATSSIRTYFVAAGTLVPHLKHIVQAGGRHYVPP